MRAVHRMAGSLLPVGQVTVVGIPQGWTLPGLRLVADVSPLVWDRTTDTSARRNLGLALAKKFGWRAVLFLDDDVYGPSAAGLARAAELLLDPQAGVDAVGWAFEAYPDNSIVCHENSTSAIS